jgi:hypothetical protein
VESPNRALTALADDSVHSVLRNTSQHTPQVWRRSSFAQRRRLLQVLLKFIIGHQTEICRCVFVVCV